MKPSTISAVEIADEKLWKKFPELQGRKLSSDPSDDPYKQEWKNFYREAINQQNTDNAGITPQINRLAVLPCSVDNKNNTGLVPKVPSKTNSLQETCKFSSLTVNKNNRKYILTLTPGQDKSLPTSLEVVGGEKNKPAEISANLNGFVQSVAECNHLQNTFSYYFNNNELLNKPTLTALNFKAYGPKFKSFKIWNATPNYYSFNVSTCGSQSGCTIAVYPDITYSEVSIEFPKPELRNENKLTPKKNFDKVEIENTKSQNWGVAFSGSIIKDGEKLSIELEFNREIEKIKKVSTIAKSLQEHLSILGNGGKVEPVSFTIKLPNLKFGYTGNWVELEGSPLCDFQNELSIHFEPLIGIDIKVDILAAAAVAIGGPLGKVVNFVRGLAKKNIDIKFDFCLSGEAGGGWTGKYLRNAKKWISNDLEIKVPISAILEAGVEGKFERGEFYIGGGVEGNAKGSVEFKAIFDNNADWQITFMHNGLKLTGGVFFKLTFNRRSRDDEELDSDAGPKFKGEVVIIPPQENPVIIYP
jgi:hypothetical protein